MAREIVPFPNRKSEPKPTVPHSFRALCEMSGGMEPSVRILKCLEFSFTQSGMDQVCQDPGATHPPLISQKARNEWGTE